MEQEEMEMVDDEDEEQQLEDEEQQWQEMNVLEMHAISIHIKLLDAAANDEDVDFEQCDGQQDHHQFDHRSLGRSARRKFRHDHARQCIMRDYLGTNALMGAEFKLMFRITRGRFQHLMESIAATGSSYYVKRGKNSKHVASFEAKLLLPLKTLAYGVPPHCFSDYFQMSSTMAKDCCVMFDKAVSKVYKKEYLRVPTAADIKNICRLHKAVHNVDGMIGSLDCSHTYWKNCPKAWQGSYSGKEKKPSIVLEAISDYHLFFWHASYGYAGTLNDINILKLSPFLDRLIDGSMDEDEKEAGVVPYTINNEEFQKAAFILVDGIYPLWTRFVRGIKEPCGQKEKVFTGWQEGARKDIERAFGVLKGKFQFMETPIKLMDLKQIGKRVTTCLILHNVCVHDRIMEQDYEATYNPAVSLLDGDENFLVEQPPDIQDYGGVRVANPANIGVDRLHISDVEQHLTRKDRFLELIDQQECARLFGALMEYHYNLVGNKE